MGRLTEADGPHGFGARLKAHWAFKTVAMTFFTMAFFCGYFLLLNHPVFPVTVMPLTALDRWIGFQPAALVLYISLWFYVPLAPGLIIDKRELVTYYWAMLGLALAGLAVFFFWPTAVPRQEIDWMDQPAFGELKAVDSSGNACPSLHVAFAIFTAIWLDRLLRRVGRHAWLRVLNWCWCAGILYSTIATKQHVAIDVVAGAALGVIAAVVHGHQVRTRSTSASLERARPVRAS
jgi:membrane-associated phospholipid phosphatase